MKKKAKAKTIKKTKSPAKRVKTEETDLPELVAVMSKIAERLAGLESKMEMVLRQTAGRSSDSRPMPQNVQRYESQQPQHRLQPQHAGGNVNPAASQNQGWHSGRPLYKAVCADCHKTCEVPFKVTGDRPVYCKECFATRKAASRGPQQVQRQVRVIPNGAGKVTISELVPAGAQPRSTGRSKKRK